MSYALVNDAAGRVGVRRRTSPFQGGSCPSHSNAHRHQKFRCGPPAPRAHAEYQPFGNMETRNGLQELVEIPMLLLALRLPSGGRILEIGCGRGVALPVLAK